MQDEQQPQTPEVIPPIQPDDTLPSEPKKRLPAKLLIGVVAAVVLIGGGAAYFLLQRNDQEAPNAQTESSANQPAETETTELTAAGELTLDTSKNYGDKYADGILPVGDEMFVTDTAKKGYVYLCDDNFVPDSQAGASTRGPWFVGTTQWNINKKYAVRGSVDWQESLSTSISGSNRVITTNGLPNHVSGTFPVASSDPAYQYDRNPNTIKSQDLTYTLNASPSYGKPQCMGGEVGVLLTGVALFNAFDAGGRDAGAWEIQDACEGHPQSSGLYHYHTLSSCINDVSVNTVIGYALDGFPITGPKVGDGNYLTTSDLDECHGITSEINVDSKKVTMYHYVMTMDFPYSVSCFRSAATQAPGQHSGGQQQSSGTQQPSQPPLQGGGTPGQKPPKLQ